MGYAIITIAIVLAAAAGFAFVKNGELAGLGRGGKRGGLRNPHGALVRTKRLDATEQTSFPYRFGILLAIVVGVTALLGLVSFTQILNWGSATFLTVHFILCVGLCMGVSMSDSGMWRPLAWALLGYLVLALVPNVLWVYEVTFVASLSFAHVNALTALLGGVGCALGAALMPPLFSYAREFEDGHVNAIQVSGNSIARKAYDALLDPSWKPPADRIKDFRAAEDVRSFMEKR